jgi:hypothetical protein
MNLLIIHASVPHHSPDPERFDAVHDELEGMAEAAAGAGHRGSFPVCL